MSTANVIRIEADAKAKLKLRDRDADFVQQARELAAYFFDKDDRHDPRIMMRYWLAKGHAIVKHAYTRYLKG